MTPATLTQVLASVNPADAVSDFARQIARRARERGIRTELLAAGVHPDCRHEARELGAEPSSLGEGGRDGLVLIHHSIGTGLVERVLALPGRRVVVHHSVTPSEYFEGVSPAHVAAARLGVQELGQYSEQLDEAVGVSRFDVAEARAAGFARVGLLPVLPPPSRVTVAHAELPGWLRDAGFEPRDVLVLAVGRLAPNKRVEDLLAMHGVLARILPSSWLVVVGSDSGFEGYGAVLRDQAARIGAPRMLLPGEVSDADLTALYGHASVLVSASEHEGCGLPLVEAMTLGLPVIALARAAVPETLGEAGLIFESFDALRWAEAVRLIVEDGELRTELVEAGRRRATGFRPEVLDEALDRLLAGELPPCP